MRIHDNGQTKSLNPGLVQKTIPQDLLLPTRFLHCCEGAFDWDAPPPLWGGGMPPGGGTPPLPLAP